MLLIVKWNEHTYRVKPLEMTSVSCTKRRALRVSPVRVLLLWTRVWSCVALVWTSVCIRPRLHSVTPLSPTQPRRTRPHGAAATDHRLSGEEQSPSSTAVKPTSPATSLKHDDRSVNLFLIYFNTKWRTVVYFFCHLLRMENGAEDSRSICCFL